jgi:hypothetical protein
MKNQTIWTRNVLTGIPDTHSASVDGCVAKYEENGFLVTCYGGFFLSESAARRDTRDAVEANLAFYLRNAEIARAALAKARTS